MSDFIAKLIKTFKIKTGKNSSLMRRRKAQLAWAGKADEEVRPPEINKGK